MLYVIIDTPSNDLECEILSSWPPTHRFYDDDDNIILTATFYQYDPYIHKYNITLQQHYTKTMLTILKESQCRECRKLLSI